ncbi:MAG: efflux RND transporter permease subunit, partial [Kiritimatiellia bacterium]|nr:efflux RND transporter permease subunit [Kiritimatiellia bacterium]
PFTVLVSIPFGLIGVIFALILHGKPLSMMAMLGMVGMAGVVVNDAIVLVSFINGLRRDGMPVHDAILEGARKRVRPILLTSVTTVLGLAPVIYGIGGYEPFVAPAAIVLAYGLVFATFLTLLVVPCMYSIGADIKGWVGRRRR